MNMERYAGYLLFGFGVGFLGSCGDSVSIVLCILPMAIGAAILSEGK